MERNQQSPNMQARSYLITLNNPSKYGYTREQIISLVKMLSVVYACLCYEVGEQGTEHVHIYVTRKSPIRFARIKNLFPEAHIDKAYGSAKSNRDYITKSGDWADSEKSHTNMPETFWEIGTMPPEHEKVADKNERMIAMIEEGLSEIEIIRKEPSYALKLKDVSNLRQSIIQEKYQEEFRAVEVIYLFGATGTGKTRSIFEQHAAKDICRITHYKSDGSILFDSYNGQSVLVLEEFTGKTDITFMLNLLDVYPLMLPARYHDKVARFTKVYITSNTPLYDLYPQIQSSAPQTWLAFLRRIHKTIRFEKDGTKTEVIITEKPEIGGKPDDNKKQ